MKNFKIIGDYEEFKKYFMEANDYIKRENAEQQEKDCKYFYKKRILLITNDGYILELENDPSINKTLWYDDETPTPEKTEQYFLNYNINLNLPYRNITEYLQEKERLLKTGGASGKYDYNGIYFTNPYASQKRIGFDYLYEKDKYFVRYMTEEEQNELIEIIKQLQNSYIERLKKYYKRYSKNICISGYWANR